MSHPITVDDARTFLTESFGAEEFVLHSVANKVDATFIDKQGINVIVRLDDNRFELKYRVTRSIFELDCPTCSPFLDGPEKKYNQFEKMYTKFKDACLHISMAYPDWKHE